MSTTRSTTNPQSQLSTANTATATIASTTNASNAKRNETAKKKMATMITDQPEYWDVTLGRGRCFQEHPGNIRMHAIVGEYKARYSRGNNHEKRQIVLRVMKVIKARPTPPQAPSCTTEGVSSYGGQSLRFLKRRTASEKIEQDCQEIYPSWEEVSDAMAFKKVQHALRGKGQGSKYTLSALPRSKGAGLHEDGARDSTQPYLPTAYSTGVAPRSDGIGNDRGGESWPRRCTLDDDRRGEEPTLYVYDESVEVSSPDHTDVLEHAHYPRSFEASKTTTSIRGLHEPIGTAMLARQDTAYADGVGYHPSCSTSPSEVSLDDSLEPLPVHAADSDPFSGHDVLSHFSSELLLIARPNEEVPAPASGKDDTKLSTHQKTPCPSVTAFERRDGRTHQYHHPAGAERRDYFHHQSRRFPPDANEMKPRCYANCFLPPPNHDLRLQEHPSTGGWVNRRRSYESATPTTTTTNGYWHQYGHHSWANLAYEQSATAPIDYQTNTSRGQHPSLKSQVYFCSQPTPDASNLANDWFDQMEEMGLELDLEGDLDQDGYLSIDPVPLHDAPTPPNFHEI